jgi:hypothetical protein
MRQREANAAGERNIHRGLWHAFYYSLTDMGTWKGLALVAYGVLYTHHGAHYHSLFSILLSTCTCSSNDLSSWRGRCCLAQDPTHVMAQFSAISRRVPSISRRVILSHQASSKLQRQPNAHHTIITRLCLRAYAQSVSRDYNYKLHVADYGSGRAINITAATSRTRTKNAS